MPSDDDRIHFVADRGDSRLRLDQVIVRRVSDISRLSRSVAQRWIEAGVVTVDDRTVSRPAARVREGAVVRIALPADAARRVRPAAEPAALDVLHEDASLLIVNKPAGMVVHPTYKQTSGTLLNAVLWRLRDTPDVRPGVLTRLDKDTSGIVVVALSAGVHAALQRGGAKKEYAAIVAGVPSPPAGTISLPLARDPEDRRRVIVTPGGAASETRYVVIASQQRLASAGEEPLSLVHCELITGRTHQIRVHLAASGWPIAGDRVYGSAHAAIDRQALHARRITLRHPVSGSELVVEAPMPADMERLLATIAGAT